MRDFLTSFMSAVFAPSTATRRQRRALGVVILILVVFLVLLGSFLLKAGVSPGTSLLFWGICFLLVLWSVFLAYLDVKSLKDELRAQRKEMFLSIFSKPDLKRERREAGATGVAFRKQKIDRQADSRRAPEPD